MEHLAIGRENLLFRQHTKVLAALVDERKGDGIGIVKLIHHLCHVHCRIELGWRANHDLFDCHALIESRLEHDVAHIVDGDYAKEASVVVADGEGVMLRVGDDIDQLPETPFRAHYLIVSERDIVEI